MSSKDRKYEFTWDVIGTDMSIARPNLGDTTNVAVYRLFQFSLRDVIEQSYGTEAADKLFLDAGVIAGRAFFQKFCSEAKDLTSLVQIIQQQLKDLGIGIFRVEISDPEKNFFQFTVDEDLDCSGLPDTAEEICIYDEGFIKGILDAFTGGNFQVKEVDCWSAGSRTCRFAAQGQ